MKPTTERTCIYLFSILFSLAANNIHAQVVAGIRANGRLMNNGDTLFICKNTNVNYQSAAQNATGYNWRFNNGSPNNSAATNPGNILYTTAGTDNTVQVVNGPGGSDSMIIFIQVSDVFPSANFSFSPDNVCGNIPISFTSLSTGNNLTYLWDFGDGATSTQQNTSHQFLNAIGTPGIQTYNVKLVVTSRDGCKDSIIKTVTIKKVPDASIGNGDATVQFGMFNGTPTFKKCNNLPFYTFTFNNQSSTISINTSYTIKWGDGSPDSTFASWPAGVPITHTYPLGGKTLTVEVTGPDGCIGIKNHLVFLGSNPSGGISSQGNTDVCEKDSLCFEINSIPGNPNPPGTTYTFLVNDGSGPRVFQHPPPANVCHRFTRSSCGAISSSGLDTYSNAYGAYLTIQNACGSTSPAVVPIYVTGKPTASFRTIPQGVACLGTPVNVQNLSSYGTNPATGCNNSGVQVWTISPATGYTTTPASLGSLNGQPGNALAWTNGPVNFTINFTLPGTYTIKLYISNMRCGVDSTVRTICVRTAPQASFTKPSGSSCGPATVPFTNTSPPGGCNGDTYEWQVQFTDPLNCSDNTTPAYEFANGTSATSISPEISFRKPGRFIITLTARANGGVCPPAVFTDTFLVKGPPKVSLNPSGTICPGNTVTPSASASVCYSTGNLGYQWTFNNGTPAGSTSSNPGPVLYNNIGHYAISLTVTDSSCNTTATATDTVHVVNPPAADAGADKNFCSGQTVQIGSPPVPNITYTWSPATGLSNNTIANPSVTLIYNGLAPDTTYTYYVDISAGATCKGSDTVLVTVKRSPLVSITPAAVAICKDSSIVLTASGADTYLWQPGGAVTASITVNPTITTDYIVTGSLANSCPGKDTARITVSDKAKADFLLRDSIYCIPLKLDTVIGVTPYPGRNGRYDWYIDGILQATNTNGAPPAITINTPNDTIFIKLVTISAAGCAPDSLERRLITRPSVTALFTKDTSSGCGPLPVQFTNASSPVSNNLVQYTWLFGNGTTSSLRQPGPVIYPSSPWFSDTTYYITLKVYAGCDTSYYRDSVKVFPGPSARFSITPTTGCSPFRVKLINNSLGNNIAYYWDFDDGTRDTTFLRTDTVQHTFITGVVDTFRVRLVAVNNCGRDTQYLSVIVSPSTIQPIIVVGGPSLFGCAPHNAIFTNNSVGAVKLIWNFGDGSGPDTTSNLQSTISHLYSTPGIYNVAVRLINDCTDTTLFRQITVYTKPQASFVLNRNSICPGDPVSVTSTATNANAVEWLWGDGGISAGNTATHIFTAPGIYNIRLVAKRVNNFGVVCTDTSAPQAVNVLANIPAVIRIDSTNKFCAPFTLNVEAIAAGGASIVRWTFYDASTPPGEFTVNGLNAAYTFTQPGNHRVKLYTQNAAGCTDSSVQGITVYPVPVASFTPGNLSTCFADTVVRYTATYAYPWTDPLSLRWYVNGQQAGSGNILNYVFRLPAGAARPYVFNIRLLPQNAAGCGDSTAPATLTIKPVPGAGIKVLPGVVQRMPNYTFAFSDTFPSNPNHTHTWNMGDGRAFVFQQNFNYTYGDTGTYKVLLRVDDFLTKCMQKDSVEVTILNVPGYMYVPNAFYPDSRKNELKIFRPVASGLSTYHLRIYDTWGRLLFESTQLDNDGSPVEGWNGKDMQQKNMDGDMYVWVIDATYKNGLAWEGMVYERHSNSAGFQPKPKRQGFVRLFR